MSSLKPICGLFLVALIWCNTSNGHQHSTFADLTLLEMRSWGMESRNTSSQPWSGDYWPKYRGGIAFPYADLSLPSDPVARALITALARISSDEPINTVYVPVSAQRMYFSALNEKLEQLAAKARSGTLTTEEISRLAPSEKLDLFLEDSEFHITRAMVRGRMEIFSSVSIWEGICHGWAGAAIQQPRPMRVISVWSLQKRTLIPFYPDDIKALLSYDGSLRTGKRLLGKRSSFTKPHSEHFSPRDFHQLVVNKLNIEKSAFVIDIDLSPAVWNQPVFSYRYGYFSPAPGENEKTIRNVEQAIVPIWRLGKESILLSGRPYAPGTTDLIGVRLTLQYVREVEAGFHETDSPEMDAIGSVTYEYLLELGSGSQILDGEWLDSDNRPDFAWEPGEYREVGQLNGTQKKFVAGFALLRERLGYPRM